MKGLFTIATMVALITFSSCGKKNSEGGAGGGTAEVVDGNLNPGDPQPMEGRYDAILRPINTPVNGFIPSGRAKFNITGTGLEVTTFLEDDSKVTHIQNVYTGSRCPTLADDKNGDGFIDILEMKKVTGDVLIPLDADLNSIAAGAGSWPMGKAFTYLKNAEVGKLMTDLYENKKLPNGTHLNLSGRVVIVHGTVDITRVPESVQTVDGLPRNITVPITCGVIKRL